MDFIAQHKNFVLSLAKKDLKLHDLVDERERFCSYVKNRLEGVKALAGPENLPNSGIVECTKLEDHQLVKLVWLLDTLEMSAEFRKTLGDELELDYKDRKSAHGGVIAFKGNELKILMIPGQPTPSGLGELFENYSYAPVDFSPSPEQLFLFHFHAFEMDNSKFASPTNSDLKESERRRMDCIVFTKIMGRRFNADYYFVGRDIENRPFDVVLDLGIYEY